jgi:hypothetical protein
VVHETSKSIGELVFGNDLDEPQQALLEAFRGQREVGQLHFHSLKEKNVRRGNILRIERLLYHFDAFTNI